MPTQTSKAKSFYYDIDLQKNSLLHTRLQNVSTSERVSMGSTLNGDDKGLIVYDKDETIIYIWDGNAWHATTTSSLEVENWNEAYEKTIVDADVETDETSTTLTLTREDDTTLTTSWTTSAIHVQSVPSETWTINHTLNKYPSVTVVDSANSEVYGEVYYTSSNQIILSFSAAFSGKAYLN